MKPHPGEDGKPDTGDELSHFGNGVKVPFCTREQIDQGELSNPLCYQSNPPTSGPHSGSPAAFKIYENPVGKENAIHSMEHGGVVVWYNTADQNVVKELESVVKDQLDRRRLVVMTKYPEMEPGTIALTGMSRLDKFPVSEFAKDRVKDFIETHQRRFNPEGF